MRDSIFEALISFGLPLAFICSWLLSKWLIGYLNSKLLLDQPNHRSMHKTPTPRGGGLAFLVVVPVFGAFSSLMFLDIIGIVLIVTMLLWGTLGFCDDKLDLSPRVRFVIQIALAAIAIMLFGPVSQISYSDLGVISLIMPIAMVLSLLGYVWFVNLYNFMDGMDGLAAVQTIVAAITLAFWMHGANDLSVSFICLLLATACLGFLVFNWSPAKIFMGDVGSLSLGAVFAALFLYGVNNADTPILSFVLLFWVFIYDSGVTLLLRIKNREKVWQAHSQHHYQRLAKAGIAHDKVVILHLLLMIISSLLASISVQYPQLLIALLIISCVMSAGLTAFVRHVENKARLAT